MSLSSDFADLFAEFNAEGVEFLVIGAHALAAHGVIRGTKDLDVWVRPSDENARRVFTALARFGAPMSGAQVADFTRPGIVFQIGVPPVRIDVTTVIDGLTFEEAWTERIVTQYGDQPIAVLSREHLILNKRATARPQDLADIASLEQQR